jgi:hypothetical protein
MPTNDVSATLAERGSRYGEFAQHALYTQDLKRAMQRVPSNWRKLSDDKKEALEMVVHKIGRILNGDPEYIDSWHDIIGYVRLVEKNLEMAQTTKAANPIGRKSVLDRPIEHFCDVTGSMEPGYVVECRHCSSGATNVR